MFGHGRAMRERNGEGVGDMWVASRRLLHVLQEVSTMYMLLNLHVHPLLPVCTSRSTCMYIPFKLHVHPVQTTCTSRSNYMYIPFELHVHPVRPTCTSKKNYMYIQFFLHVHPVFPTCTCRSNYMYIQLFLIVHVRKPDRFHLYRESGPVCGENGVKRWKVCRLLTCTIGSFTSDVDLL